MYKQVCYQRSNVCYGGSSGLDKGPRTMEVIHSYPSPPNGWR